MHKLGPLKEVILEKGPSEAKPPTKLQQRSKFPFKSFSSLSPLKAPKIPAGFKLTDLIDIEKRKNSASLGKL